ncbi:aldo/keto reductase [Olivibacter sitiensis]|uniref:aldo/keto reductase n=1 Tax=Olivibacter sitiensis TaxID=376470 RepID=UPI0004825D6E|nr:aldo/keto reductase [Olivibacter sitiensis]
MVQLGKSDLQVSELAFGCMSLGDNQKHVSHLLNKAFDKGINFFDTADLYNKGLNELHVGTALKDIRKKVILTTKVGNQLRPDGSGWDWNPTKDYILKAVDQSLKRLQTDYIDLYQLHGGTIDDPIDETIEAFELLKKQGKIRWYGISSIRPNVIREYVKRSNIQSVMMQYSLLDRRPEEEVLQLLQEQGISVIARGGVAQGLLLGKEPKDYLQYTASEVAKEARAVEALAEQRNCDAITIALSYLWHHPVVASAVTGIRTEEQLDEALKAWENKVSLSNEEVYALSSQIRAIHYTEHR